MTRKNMMLVISGSALGLASVAVGSPDLDRAYAAELRADAAAHTSLLQAGGSGHDGAFFLGDAAGNNRLEISGLLQFQYVFNSRDNTTAGGEDLTTGFNAQRVQLDFGGNVVNPNWEYGIGLEFGNADRLNGNAQIGNLRHAFIKYNFEGDGAGSSFTVGQFLVPVVAEDNTSDANLLAVERSLVNEFFSAGYTQGVAYTYAADDFMFMGSINDGGGVQGIGIGGPTNSGIGASNSDISLTGRFDYKFEGDWAQFEDGATSWKGSADGLRVGGGIHWQTGGDSSNAAGTATTPDLDYILWTVDARYESNGWNVGAAVIGNSIDFGPGAGGFANVDGDNLGIVVDGGVFVSDDVEVFGRYEYLDIDSNFIGAGSADSVSAFTVGANYYLVPESQAAKVTVDFVFNTEDALVGAANSGFASDASFFSNFDDEFAFRTQLQLAF